VLFRSGLGVVEGFVVLVRVVVDQVGEVVFERDEGPGRAAWVGVVATKAYFEGAVGFGAEAQVLRRAVSKVVGRGRAVSGGGLEVRSDSLGQGMRARQLPGGLGR